MTHKTKDGGPAFPNYPTSYQYNPDQKGMTLRDWFAGQALGATIASIEIEGTVSIEDVAQAVSKGAYAIADALLAFCKHGGEE